MKEFLRAFLEYIAETTHKYSERGKVFKFYQISAFATFMPLIPMTIWGVYDYFANVDYRIEDEFVTLGFWIASIANVFIGIKLGKSMLEKEQKKERIDLVQSLKDKIEAEQKESFKTEQK